MSQEIVKRDQGSGGVRPRRIVQGVAAGAGLVLLTGLFLPLTTVIVGTVVVGVGASLPEIKKILW